jgi:Holliday junction resolvase RusA-like endonuclease
VSRASFRVSGYPAPKGSRITGTRKNGSIYTRPASQRERPWVEAVALTARVYRPCKVLEPPYEIELEFSMPEGQRPKWGWPTKDGDLDKICRSTIDGLVQGGLLLDDRHVTKLTASKRFAAPDAIGVGISIA